MFTNDEELVRIREIVHRMVERAIAMDGTCKFCLHVFASSCVDRVTRRQIAADRLLCLYLHGEALGKAVGSANLTGLHLHLAL